MRALFFASAALMAAPAYAQDHSAHQHSASSAQDHSAHQQADDEAQDHSAHQQPQQEMDHSAHQPTPAPPRTITIDPQRVRAAQDQIDASAVPVDNTPPPRAFEGPAHAAAAIWGEEPMARARARNHEIHGGQLFGTIMAERFEARIGEGHDEYAWDVQGWYGSPVDRVVFKSEGEGEFGEGVEEAEVQLLWGHAIGPWFDLQTGIRLDVEPETRAHAVVGVAGLAPYMIHVDAAAFLSDRGDLTARLEAEHDMRFTQSLILQPRIEVELSAQDIPERGIGAGIPEIAVGARLRYEIVPEIAPYIGVEYEAATGRTARWIRDAGDDPDGFVFLIGLRTWF